MNDYMEPRDQHKKQGYIWVLIALAIIFLLWAYSGISNAADLPEYTDLTFTDQADLDGQVDSALAVCHQDSVYYLVDFYGNPDWIFFPVCRRFAGLTVFWMPEEPRPGNWTYSPTRGKARLWWWEEED